MAIAGRRRVPAGFTNVTYRTVGRLVNRLAAGTDCVPPGTALSAVPAYEDDDGRWYALRTAVPPRLSHRLRRSELPHNGAYRNTPRGQIAAHGHGTVRSPI